MKKCLSCLFAILVLLSCCLSVPVSAFFQDEEESFGLAKGYVRTKIVYQDTFGEHTTITRTFDKKGHMLKETTKTKSEFGQETNICTYKYDKKGRLVKAVGSFRDSDGKTSGSTVTYQYNSQGKLIQEKQTGEIPYTNKYTYDKSGNLIKQTYICTEFTTVTTFTYNEKGKVVKEATKSVFQESGQTTSTTVHTYDQKGREIKKVYRSSSTDGSKSQVTETTVYSKGLPVKYSYVSFSTERDGTKSNPEKWNTVNTYNSKGKLIRKVEQHVTSSGEKATSATTYTLDNKGRVIKEENTQKGCDGNGKSYYSYTYDNQGRLIKTTTIQKSAEGTAKHVDALTLDKAGNMRKRVQTGSGIYGYSKCVWVDTYQKIGA